MKEKKRKPVWLVIVLCLVLYFVLYGIMFGGIFAFAFIADANSKQKYEVKDNKVIVENNKIEIENLESRYDEEKKCYVIDSKITVNDNMKKRFFTGESLTITYTLYDKDGYVVGTTEAYTESIRENKKFKKSATYCEEFADTVVTYKVTDITLY